MGLVADKGAVEADAVAEDGAGAEVGVGDLAGETDVYTGGQE